MAKTPRSARGPRPANAARVSGIDYGKLPVHFGYALKRAQVVAFDAFERVDVGVAWSALAVLVAGLAGRFPFRACDRITTALLIGTAARLLANPALGEYPIRVTRLRLVGGFTNVIFRVDADEGVFAVRIDLHQEHTDADVAIETAWLRALHDETDLDVACVVPTIAGGCHVPSPAGRIEGGVVLGQ